MTENDILNALREAYQRAGTQTALAQVAGVSQGRIADYLNGRCSIGNMSVATLLKIFPDIKIDFFGEKTGNDESDLRRTMYLCQRSHVGYYAGDPLLCRDRSGRRYRHRPGSASRGDRAKCGRTAASRPALARRLAGS